MFFKKTRKLPDYMVDIKKSDQERRELFKQDILKKIEDRITQLKQEKDSFFSLNKARKERKIEILALIHTSIKDDQIFSIYEPTEGYEHLHEPRAEKHIKDARSISGRLDTGIVSSRTKDLLDEIVQDAKSLEDMIQVAKMGL